MQSILHTILRSCHAADLTSLSFGAAAEGFVSVRRASVAAMNRLEPHRPPAAPGSGDSMPAIRERAEAVLRELVGRADARLRQDQWRAIEALVVQRRRALGRVM